MTDSTSKNEDISIKKRRFTTKGIVYLIWALFGMGVLSVALVFFLISNGVIGYMPDIQDLENPIDKYATQVYTADGELMGTYSYAKNNRIYSDFSDLPKHLVDALVSTEDARYYQHSGIDFKALARVIGKTIFMGNSSSGGGSTISQQLAKLLYSPKSNNLVSRSMKKPIEWVIASRLERYYTKDEILNLYLSQFDFLNNAVGIKSAAQVYFNKLPQDLTIEESATLVGMCQNPAYYNPANPKKIDRTEKRRNVVLSQMYKYNYLTKQQFDSLKQIPLVLDFRRTDHKDGIASYLREYLRTTLSASKPDKSKYASWQIQQYKQDSLNWETNPMYGWCNKNRKADGSSYSLGTDGLKIYTTIDSRMQQYAEAAMSQHMSQVLQPNFEKEKKGRNYAPFAYRSRNKVNQVMERLVKQSDRYRRMKRDEKSDDQIKKAFNTPVEMKVFSWAGDIDTIMTPMDSIRYQLKFMRSGFMAMDTHTGHVKAYVGGIDFKHFQYDMVNRGRRQVGSTIKPFLYSLSMEEGATPCDEMLHVEQTLKDESGRPWTPRNSNQNRVGEMVSIKWGLQNSDNWVTTYLMGRTSPYSFARLLRSFGITGHIDPVISMCLGSPDVSVSEMAAAYTAFANKGIRVNPMYITRIEDQYGNILTTFMPEMHEVFSERTYVKMIDMLRSVIDEGTGRRVRHYVPEGQLGGKTGTTNDNVDGWFMCFSPRLSTACWVGGEDINVHFDRMSEGQGAAMALPISASFLKKVYADKSLNYSSDDQFEAVLEIDDPCAKLDQEHNNQDAESVKIDEMFN